MQSQWIRTCNLGMMAVGLVAVPASVPEGDDLKEGLCPPCHKLLRANAK